MNPILAATATKVAADSIKDGSLQKIVEAQSKPIKWVLAFFLGGLALFVLYKVSTRWREQLQRNSANNLNMEKDPKAALASTYAQRINGAWSWYNDDEEAIFQVAREMKANQVPFSLVAKMYKNLYQIELSKALEKLSQSELTTFYLHAGMSGVRK